MAYINREVVIFNKFLLDVRRSFEVCELAQDSNQFKSAFAGLRQLVTKRINYEADVLYPAILKMFE